MILKRLGKVLTQRTPLPNTSMHRDSRVSRDCCHNIYRLIPKTTLHAQSQPLMVTKLARPIPYHPTSFTLLKGSQGNPQSDEYTAILQRSGPYCCYHYATQFNFCLIFFSSLHLTFLARTLLVVVRSNPILDVQTTPSAFAIFQGLLQGLIDPWTFSDFTG